jgi:peptidoglycan/xylan/chitin deacetylase (PgdA/CDA1 family)
MAFVCLMYHSLSDGRFPDGSYPKYTTTRALFTEHLRLIRDNGFRFLNFSELLRDLEAGTAPPEKSCVLTFDDGHKSSLDLVEIMKEYGATGTFLLTMGYCQEREDFLKPAQILEMARNGFDFGTHGTTHRSLAHMPRAHMKAELSESKDWLEGILGRSVTSMSLPAGQGDEAVYQTAYDLGYQLVGNSCEQTNDTISLPAAINRFVILSHHDAALVHRMASGSRAYVWQRRLRAAAIYLPKRILQPYNETRRQQ